MFLLPFPSKRMSRTDSSGDSTPKESGSQTSTEDISLQSTASNVPWRDENSPINFPLSAHLLARSALSSTPSPSVPRITAIPERSSLQISSTQSLKVDLRVRPASDNGYYGFGNHQLSPIAEQDYLSPEKMSLSLPSEHSNDKRNPSSTRSELSDVSRVSPVYSAFITRPLKMSTSQGTFGTYRSYKTAPPSIPPLDLRPTFSRDLDSPPLLTPSRRSISPLRARSAGAARPLHECCGSNDASSLHADSFISAPSLARKEPRQPTDTNHCPRLERGSITFSDTTHSSGLSESSSYIDRRCAASLSFDSDNSQFAKSRRKPQTTQTLPTPACFLFWLGFVAPWCWMLGGWMLADSGHMKEEGNDEGSLRSFVLPLYNSKSSGNGIKGGQGKVGKTGSILAAQGYGFARGYPFIAPSLESLTSSEKVLRMKLTTSPKTLDPWVARCRIAGVISGILLLIGFVVAFIEVGKGR